MSLEHLGDWLPCWLEIPRNAKVETAEALIFVSDHTRFLSKRLYLLTEVSESCDTAVDEEAGLEELYSVLQGWVQYRYPTTSSRAQAGNPACGSAFQVRCVFVIAVDVMRQRRSGRPTSELVRNVMCLAGNGPTAQGCQEVSAVFSPARQKVN